ncbi:tetratricopeptide repeat protein [Spongiibacter nanhainus]|uniref:Tetratricopeptide repeat protein n=1 Tax=Spongiibacter nanhainus TaxID=2794344 RepID=A0A7T4QZ59_9GAMM|nr:tetratricopeptide repeat protein [Spongiibacter nanhainus]QQD17484.1 tetratricopeptide repeat protein [Spongiibacter nanhainus]
MDLPIQAPSEAETDALLQQGALFEVSEDTPPPDDGILDMDQTMRSFVEEHVPSVLQPRARLRYLIDSLLRPSQLGLEYNPGITHNAADTFYQREGNCLALTSLFITMAREAGLEAHYNQVAVPPSWEMLSNNSLAVYKHINAVVVLEGGEEVVVDLSVDNYEYLYAQTRLSESEAAAQFYSNRGIDMLNSGDHRQAYRYFRRALQLNPKEAFIWGNLGSLFRREGHNDMAEIAYRQALSLDAHEPTALSNLGRLYRGTGEKALAKSLEEYNHQLQRRNPFWHYSRARDAYERGNYTEALTAIQRAIYLQRDEYRFYEFAAVIYRRKGDREKYEEYGLKAARLKFSED